MDKLLQGGFAIRCACEFPALHRATFQYQERPVPQDELLAELQMLVQANPRYGYRRAWAVFKRTRVINSKRVHRLWKQAQL